MSLKHCTLNRNFSSLFTQYVFICDMCLICKACNCVLSKHPGCAGEHSVSMCCCIQHRPSTCKHDFSEYMVLSNVCEDVYNNVCVEDSFIKYNPHETSVCVEKVIVDHLNVAVTKGQDIADHIHNVAVPYCPTEPIGCLLKHETIAFMNLYEHVLFDVGDIQEVLISVDGGYDPTNCKMYECSWSISVICVTSCAHKLVAIQGGAITADPSSTIFLGQKSPLNAYVAELYAHVMAYLFVIQHMNYFVDINIPICILYDNMSANNAVDSTNISDPQYPLAMLANAMETMAANLGFNLYSTHIKKQLWSPIE